MAAQPLPLEIASPGFRQMDLKRAQEEAHAQREALRLIRVVPKLVSALVLGRFRVDC